MDQQVEQLLSQLREETSKITALLDDENGRDMMSWFVALSTRLNNVRHYIDELQGR